MIPVFALPLFVDPVWWAERFGWDTAGAAELTNYLGRCLGAVALAIEGDQPAIEHAETLFFATFALAALVCRPPTAATGNPV